MSVFNKNTRRVLSYNVLQQQKTEVMTKGVFDLPLSPAYNVEPVTDILSSLCEQRTTDAVVSARHSPPFVAALFFTLRDSYG